MKNRMPPLPQDVIDRGIDFYENRGWSIGRLSRELGKSEGFWTYRLLKAGAIPSQGIRKVRVTTSARCRRFDPTEDAGITAMALAGLSYADISRITGRSSTAIRVRLLMLARRDAQREAE